MAIDGGDVKFTFSGDSSQLRAELDALSDNLQEVNESGQGAANSLDRELNKAATNTGTTFTKTSASTDKAASSTVKLGQAANRAGDHMTGAAGAVGSVATVIGHFNPEVAESIRVVGDMTNSAGQLMKAMAAGPAVFAAAAAAAAAYALAVASVAEEQEKHEEADRRAQIAMDRVTSAIARQEELRTRIRAAYDAQFGTQERAIDFLDRERAAVQRGLAQDIEATERRVRNGNLTEAASQRFIQSHRDRAAALDAQVIATYGAMLVDERYHDQQIEILTSQAQQKLSNERLTQSLIDYAVNVRGLLDLEANLIKLDGEWFTQSTLGARLMSEYSDILNLSALSEMAVRDARAEQLPVLQEQQAAMMETRRQQMGLSQDLEITEKAFEEQAGAAFLLSQQYEEQYGGAFQVVLGNGEVVDSLGDVDGAIQGAVSGYETLISVQDTESGQLMTLAEFLQQAHREEMAAARAREAQAEADERERQARYRARRARREQEIAQIQGMVEAEIEAMTGRTRQVRIGLMDEMDALDARYKDELEALEQTAMAHIERQEAGALSEDLLTKHLQESTDLREALDVQYAERRTEIEQQLSDNLTSIHDQRRDEQKAKDAQDLADQEELQKAYAAGWADLSGTIADVYAAKADKMAESDKQAALNAYEASKAASIIQAQINAAVAITDIFSEHAGNPLAIGVLSAVAIAATGAQIAAIASTPPPFHSGGVIGDPKERQITALDGEAVLNRQATSALGRGGVNALNSGQGLSPQVVALPVYKHFDKFVRDESKRGGRLTQLLRPSSGYGTGQRGF